MSNAVTTSLPLMCFLKVWMLSHINIPWIIILLPTVSLNFILSLWTLQKYYRSSLFGKYFFLHYWMIALLDTEFLADSFFLSAIWMSFHCFLSSLVSDEKLALNCIDSPLYVMNRFSLAAFKVFSLFLAFNSLKMMWIFFVFILLRVDWASWLCRLF